MNATPGLLLGTLLALVPSAGRAQQAGTASTSGSGTSGVVVSLDAGGGTALGAGGRFDSGQGEVELGAGLQLPYGIRPELTFVLGLAPDTHVGLRPGIHVALPDTPLYLRVAGDWSTTGGASSWRWLLGGAGAELRLTGLLGIFAEGDLGIPLESDVGLGVLVRAGISVRL